MRSLAVLASILCVAPAAIAQTRVADQAEPAAKSKVPLPTLPIPAYPQPPLLTAKASLVMDAATGRILWSKNPDVRRFPASTTKMMTAMLLLEKALPDDVVTMPKEVSQAGGSRLGLKPGMKMTVRDLVTAMMVLSANDACMAAAVHSAGSISAFAKLMTERAKQLGCADTQFKNPHGLHDPGHYTTARDLALIGQAAIKYPLIADVVTLPSAEVQVMGEPAPRKIRNRNPLAGHDPTLRGIKTGWTNPAGRCFVGKHVNDGMEVITVVLGCDKAWAPDQVNLMAWFWQNFERADLVLAGQSVGEIQIEGALGGPAPTVAGDTLSEIVPKGFGPPTFRPYDGLKAPLPARYEVGELVWPNGLRAPVVLQNDVHSRLHVLGVAGAAAAAIITGGFAAWRWTKR